MFATAESRREAQTDEIDRQVTIKKVVHNVNMTNISDTQAAVSSSSFDNRGMRAGSTMGEYRAGSSARAGSTAREYSSGSAMQQSSSSAMQRSSGSAMYSSRAGSMARATSVGRAGSTMRY